MNSSYQLISYISDIARGEPRNIGLLLSAPGIYVLRFDDRAFGPITKESRDLDKDAILWSVEMIEESFNSANIRDEHDIQDWCSEWIRFPFVISKPRKLVFSAEEKALANADMIRHALISRANELTDRLIRPIRHRSTSTSPRIKDRLATALQNHVPIGHLTRKYTVNNTRTGVPQEVDFYINHSADIAVDVIDLKNNATIEGANAVSYQMVGKSSDILASPSVKEFVVCLPTDLRQNLDEQYELVRQMLNPYKSRMHVVEGSEACAEAVGHLMLTAD